MKPRQHIAALIIEQDTEFDPHDWLPPLDRRAALRVLGLAAIGGVMGGCGTGGSVSSAAASTTTATSRTTATSTTLTPSAVSASAGTSVTLTASVAPAAAAGTITYYNGSTSLGTATLSGGIATFTTTFAAAGTETLTAAYAGNSTYAASTSASVTVSVTGTTCAAETLEGEEGPYFVDDSATGYNRSNILANLDGTETQSGVPFALTLHIYDAKNNCVAMQGVQVDIWHCNASGVYSAESVEGTSSKSWLRGYQLSDVNGMVQFQTIVPGWYQGRTTHIHLRLRSTYDSTSNSGTNTMQLFFDQALVDTLDTSVAPYASEGKNSTTNASDRVFTQQEKGTTLMTLTGSTSAGYSATAKVYLPITT